MTLAETSVMQRHQFQLFADYSQFYIQDDDASFGDLADAWNEEAVARLLAIAPHVIGVGTVRNTTVPVTVEIHDARPEIDFAAWEQVNLASLVVGSGRIVVAGCTDYLPDAARLDLAAGTYEVLVCYAGLGSLSEDGLEGDDRYHLFFYPGRELPPQVLKSRSDGG